MHGVNPYAIKVIAEKGIDISHNKSKLIDEDYLRSCDYVVTLCGDARDKCPYTPNSVKKEHWPLADPAQIIGSEETKLVGFRQVRDEIENRVVKLYKNIQEKKSC